MRGPFWCANSFFTITHSLFGPFLTVAASGRLRSMELVEVNPSLHTNIPLKSTGGLLPLNTHPLSLTSLYRLTASCPSQWRWR